MEQQRGGRASLPAEGWGPIWGGPGSGLDGECVQHPRSAPSADPPSLGSLDVFARHALSCLPSDPELLGLSLEGRAGPGDSRAHAPKAGSRQLGVAPTPRATESLRTSWAGVLVLSHCAPPRKPQERPLPFSSPCLLTDPGTPPGWPVSISGSERPCPRSLASPQSGHRHRAVPSQGAWLSSLLTPVQDLLQSLSYVFRLAG